MSDADAILCLQDEDSQSTARGVNGGRGQKKNTASESDARKSDTTAGKSARSRPGRREPDPIAFRATASGRPSRLDRDAIDDIAAECAHDLEIDASASLETIVASRLGGRVVRGNVLASPQIEIGGPEDWTVVLRGGLGSVSERMYLAQAIGHYRLHFDGKTATTISYSAMTEDDRLMLKESLWFAIGLLLPREEFATAAAKTHSAWRLAWDFGVHYPWIASRLKELAADNPDAEHTFPKI